MQSLSRWKSARKAVAGDGADFRLNDGSRVAVIGGGPAGAFFSYFLLDMAARADPAGRAGCAGRRVAVDIYESRDFSVPGPAGCNMCGGIVSEFLVQALAAEGIRLPPTVVERGIDSYVLHTQEGSVRIAAPLGEKRIAAVHRGAGPRGVTRSRWQSFDAFLHSIAQEKGANVVRGRVDSIQWKDGRPHVGTRTSPPQAYDLLVAAVGVNSPTLDLLETVVPRYRQPRTSKTFICEFYLGQEVISRCMGTAMHVFLLRLPRLEFAALIPKGDYVSAALLGDDIDRPLVQAFLDSPQVRACFPPAWNSPLPNCHCAPRLSMRAATPVFADRVVFIGDCGVTRLYKDGIGAAYRTAKAAAVTAVFEGVSAQAFRRHYWPTCRRIARDNALGRMIFAVTRWHQKRAFDQRGILRMVAREQSRPGARPRMSGVLWDMFTGSASYADILLRTLHPLFWGRLLWEMVVGLFHRAVFQARPPPASLATDANSKDLELGRAYHDGDVIIRQGDTGDCMYVLQSGQVEVILINEDAQEVQLARLSEPDIFGEMALCDREVRSATVRALGEVRVLTVDREMFLRRVHEDPSLALRVIRRLAARVRCTDEALGKETARHAELHDVTG